MPLISIIIPVYNNTRIEMERCLKSVQAQTFRDFELLVLDDGSDAVCRDIIEDLKKNIANCVVIHKSNEGVSATRNLGVKLAQGRYITFVDADDVLQPYFLDEAVDVLQVEKPDIVYGFVRIVETEQQLYTVQQELCKNERIRKDYVIFSDSDKNALYCHMFDLLGTRFIQGKNYISRGPVARVLAKELAMKCPFETGLSLGEDAVWNLSLLKQNPKAGFVKSVWYLYFRNNDSASQAFDENYKEKCAKMLTRYWEMTIDTPSRTACLRKVFEVIRTLSIRYYLTGNFKDGGLLKAIRDLNRLLLKYPWNTILQYSNVKQAGWKELIKFLLIKTNLLLPVYAIKIKLFQ